MEAEPAHDVLDGWLTALSSSRPVPAVGAATALSAAMAASVTAKVARRSRSYITDVDVYVRAAEHLRDSLTALAEEDGPVFRSGMKLHRSAAPDAMAVASTVPWRVALLATQTCDLALNLGDLGNRNLYHDARGAATIAASCAVVAADLVRANLGEGRAVDTSARVARRAQALLAARLPHNYGFLLSNRCV